MKRQRTDKHLDEQHPHSIPTKNQTLKWIETTNIKDEGKKEYHYSHPNQQGGGLQQKNNNKLQQNVTAGANSILNETCLISDQFPIYYGDEDDFGPEQFYRSLAIYPNFIHIKTQEEQESNNIDRVIQINNNVTFDFTQDQKDYEITYLNIYQNWKMVTNFHFQRESQTYEWLEHLKKAFKFTQIQFIKKIFKEFHTHFDGIIKKKVYSSSGQITYLVLKTFNTMEFETELIQNKQELIQNQITILREFNHPNIVKIKDIPFHQKEYKGFYMQKIKGRTLKRVLEILGQDKKTKQQIEEEKKQNGSKVYKIGLISYQNRKNCIKGILQGLKVIHEKNIVHRDIQPSNIMATKNYNPVIIDFGYATKTDVKQPLLVFCGTPGYMAPEIINVTSIENVELTTKSDIFSAGVIFYEMAFGEYLFCKGDTKRLRKQVIASNELCKIEIPNNNGHVTLLQRQLMAKMLELDPKNRISAAEALQSQYFQENPINQLGEMKPLNE